MFVAWKLWPWWWTLSSVEDVDDALSNRCLATLLLGLLYGPGVVEFACVRGAGELLCDGGAQLHGDHFPSVLVLPDLDCSPLLLVGREGWVPLDAAHESLVVI